MLVFRYSLSLYTLLVLRVFLHTCFAPYNILNHLENTKHARQLVSVYMYCGGPLATILRNQKLPGNLRTSLEQLHLIDPGV